MIVKQLQEILQRQTEKQGTSDLEARSRPSSGTGNQTRKNQIRLNWSSNRSSQIDWLSLYKAIDTAG